MTRTNQLTYAIDADGLVLIPVGESGFAMIDEVDIPLVASRKWRLHNVGYAMSSGGRAMGKKRHVLMHRLICSFPIGLEVDHRNGNKLDNRRGNLRICTHAQNQKNMKQRRDSTVLRGASLDHRIQMWRSRISVDGKSVMIGYFATMQEAHDAYLAAQSRLHGEFAYGT